MTGAANYKYTFTSNSLVMNAGTTWYSMTLANSAGFTLTTNNVVRIQANNSGVQFGATGARITHTIDDDTMATASATTLATSESIKAYADSVGGGAPEGTAVLSTGEVGGTKFLREDGDGTCSWQSGGESNTAFRATRSTTQTITTTTHTKIQYDTETYDTNSDYDPTTNYRHTPTIAGKYRYIHLFEATTTGTNAFIIAQIRINGSYYSRFFTQYNIAGTIYCCCTLEIEMNGTTDYAEAFGFISAGTEVGGGAAAGFFAGGLITTD
jgi:hypothetical protein